jgi:hypothetical protein
MRETLISRKNIKSELERWAMEIEGFRKEFIQIAGYPE